MRIGAWVCLMVVGLAGVAFGEEEKRPVVYVGYAAEDVYGIIHQAKLNVQAKMVWGSMSERSRATVADIQEDIMLGRSRLPQSVRLLEKKETERLATLQYMGMRTDRETGTDIVMRGTVTMVKEEGTWRLRHETWQDVPEEEGAAGAAATP